MAIKKAWEPTPGPMATPGQVLTSLTRCTEQVSTSPLQQVRPEIESPKMTNSSIDPWTLLQFTSTSKSTPNIILIPI